MSGFRRVLSAHLLQSLPSVLQRDGRIRCWAPISEMDGRYLRVILLPDEQLDQQIQGRRSF